MRDLRSMMVGRGERSPLSGMDPRVKIVCALGLLLINLSARGPGLSVSILAFCGVLFLLSRVPLKALLLRQLFPGMAALMVLVTQLFWAEGTRVIFDIQIMGGHLTGTWEGLLHGGVVGVQVLAGVNLILVLTITTPTHRLLQGFRWLRCPDVIIEVAVLMFRYIFLLFEEGSRIREAQRVRLGFISPKKAVRSSAALGGMLFIRAYDRAGRVVESMRCRGYCGESTSRTVAGTGGRLFTELAAAVFVLSVFFLLR